VRTARRTTYGLAVEHRKRVRAGAFDAKGKKGRTTGVTYTPRGERKNRTESQCNVFGGAKEDRRLGLLSEDGEERDLHISGLGSEKKGKCGETCFGARAEEEATVMVERKKGRKKKELLFCVEYSAGSKRKGRLSGSGISPVKEDAPALGRKKERGRQIAWLRSAYPRGKEGERCGTPDWLTTGRGRRVWSLQRSEGPMEGRDCSATVYIGRPPHPLQGNRKRSSQVIARKAGDAKKRGGKRSVNAAGAEKGN